MSLIKYYVFTQKYILYFYSNRVFTNKNLLLKLREENMEISKIEGTLKHFLQKSHLPDFLFEYMAEMINEEPSTVK
jgi:hypothetical protein